MSAYDFDLTVIGAGSGGISSAILGMNLGKRVALVEKKRIGGECTWSGCIPSKALIKSAEIVHGIKHVGEYGLKFNGSSKLHTKDVMSHVRWVREHVYEGETPEIFEKMGIKVFLGDTQFIDAHHVKVGEKILSSKSFIISTGSSPFMPPIEGLDSVPFLTNENLFDLEELPDSMIILGGGPIGSEMACALNRLGVKVTVVEKSKHVLSREDDELAMILTNRLEEEGVTILCESKAVKVSSIKNRVKMVIESEKHHNPEIEADSLLVAVGRRPNVDGLNLEKAGVHYTGRGIQTDLTMRTSAKNIYAIGDVVGPYLFSHMAEYWATIAVPNAVLPIPIKKKANYDNVPWSTFTDPELARSGLTEKEALDKYGNKIRVYRFPYNDVDRAKTDRTELGLSKFICSRNGKLLGIHILGVHAADLLHEALLMKVMGLRFSKIQKMIHVYPTYGDVVKRPAGRLYADLLRDNFFIKLLQKLRKK